MYKYLLCWRYLRTRYIALASVVSVMLGVATMIVVNSVMAGFAEKMRDRLHGVLADVVVESYDVNAGFYDVPEVTSLIRQAGGDLVEEVAPTMETLGVMQITLPDGQRITRPVQIIGVHAAERARTGDFAEFLEDDQGHRIAPSFDVPEHLRLNSPAGEHLVGLAPDDPFRQVLEQEALEQVPDRGAIIGYATATIHPAGQDKDIFIAPVGSKVSLMFLSGSRNPKPEADSYTVVGYFRSGMSEYDSMHVYVPLEKLQWVRQLGDGQGRGAVNQIQVKARPETDLDALAVALQSALERYRPLNFRVSTWEQKQGALMAAVAVEQTILNILLFFIIAVAGFGILAIFSMIVVEKTRDIGVMKALGASTAGVRGIFLGYGLSLGLVGSGVGMAGGLLFVRYINEVEGLLSDLTGRKVFDDSIYYFNEIPTLVKPTTVIAIVGGALLIAVVASVWPAQRASRLQPVQALRFE